MTPAQTPSSPPTPPGSPATSPPPQGDLGLLDHPIAQELLASSLPARLGYLALDGTPRVTPIWFQWTGDALVMATFVPSPKVTALEEHPDVAISIDTDTFPPEVLQLRGPVRVERSDGPVEEYAAAANRYLGDVEATRYLDDLRERRPPMARIELRPTWVGLLDFRTRLPAALGGVTA
jgi:hypothetical protein